MHQQQALATQLQETGLEAMVQLQQAQSPVQLQQAPAEALLLQQIQAVVQLQQQLGGNSGANTNSDIAEAKTSKNTAQSTSSVAHNKYKPN